MARLALHRIARRFSGAILTGIDADDTSVILESITLLDTFVSPAWLRCESEWIEVTDYAADTPIAGQATLTIVRGAHGTSGPPLAATVTPAAAAEETICAAVAAPETVKEVVPATVSIAMVTVSTPAVSIESR